MTSPKIDLGRQGEDIAATFLKKQGYRILKRNFKTVLGEIDIIAEDSRVICFVEVKTRTTELLGSPLEAISKIKQRKLSQLALSYLKGNNLIHRKARFDIVSIIKNDQGKDRIEILKDAFDLSSPYAY